MNINTDQQNSDIVESIKKIDEKLHEENLTPQKRTKMMYEQMLKAIQMTYNPLRFRYY